ncbi:ATP-binding cassette domain-containing protein [Formosa sp. A9]|uniref:ATP-binding cassette domain-containing protein n=1 Tax=Formosa sp. A9 TaxID=3442641 RepID=UPI003EC0E616
MNSPKHFAIHSSAYSNIEPFLKRPTTENPVLNKVVQNKKGAYFSNKTLDDFIKEELLHDDFTLTSATHRHLLSLSSGERKKALLNHILKSNPDFLVLENPFDALDRESVSQLKQQLITLSKSINIIQIFNRQDDILPFTTCVLEFDKTLQTTSISEYLNRKLNRNVISLTASDIPEPIKPQKTIQSPLIRFKNVTVMYSGQTILKDINWDINRGEFWELNGENGSGKSTLVTMMIGDNPKGYGQNLYIFGKKRGSGETVWDIKQHIGYFTPSMMDLFNGHHSAINMVISGLKDSIGLYKVPSDLEIDLAKQWLQLIDLADLKDTNYYYLTETQKRLILICRAMIKHPPLLILDEPTVGLDDYGASVFISLVNQIAQNTNTAILYVSHRQEPELAPSHTYVLKKTEHGSLGNVLKS